MKKKRTSGNYLQEFRQISAHVQVCLTKSVVFLSSKQVTFSFLSHANEEIKQLLFLQLNEALGFRNDFLFPFLRQGRSLAPMHLSFSQWPVLTITLCFKQKNTASQGAEHRLSFFQASAISTCSFKAAALLGRTCNIYKMKTTGETES